MDYPWIIHGLSMDYPWIIHGLSIGLSMDYPWIIHGLSMEYPWIIHISSLDIPRIYHWIILGLSTDHPADLFPRVHFFVFWASLARSFICYCNNFLISSTPNPLVSYKKTLPVSGDPSSFLLVAIMVCLGNYKKTCARKLSRSLWSKTYELPWRAIWWRIRCLFFLWIIHGRSMDDPWMIHE